MEWEEMENKLKEHHNIIFLFFCFSLKST